MNPEYVKTLNLVLSEIQALKQASALSLWLPSVTAIVCVIITSIVALRNSSKGHKQQLKLAMLSFEAQAKQTQLEIEQQKELDILNQKKMLYGELMGLKNSLSQMYITKVEFDVISFYSWARHSLENKKDDSFFLDETKRCMQKSEDLIIAISNKQEQLYKNIGLINSTFLETEDLKKLIDIVYNYKVLKVNPIPSDATLKTIEQWQEHGRNEIHARVEADFCVPIENLLNYLSKHIND